MRVIEALREKLADTAQSEGLLEREVSVDIVPLSTEEAIGRPDRDDYPIQKGKERVIEARFGQARGQGFSDAVSNARTTVAGLLELDLTPPANQVVFTAAANAILRSCDVAQRTVHCRDKEPGLCAAQLPDYLRANHPKARRIALVGLQPAMAQALSQAGYDLVILDLDPDNIGRTKAGVVVRDGADSADILPGCDLVLATGSTLANGSIDKILLDADGVPVVFFGITISGAAATLGLERYCPLGG